MLLHALQRLPRSLPAIYPVAGRGITQFAKYTPMFHRDSTRYRESNHEVLSVLNDHWLEDQPKHKPACLRDRFGHGIVYGLGAMADWYFGPRICAHGIFVESLAAIPGMIAGRIHHYRSLRHLAQDEWIRRLMDEAENERIHLYSFMELDKLRGYEIFVEHVLQYLFRAFFFSMYCTTKYTAHRFVGYLEEVATATYTHMIDDIKKGSLPNGPAAEVAKRYWGLPEDATLLDMLLVIRADEGDHRMVNHRAADRIAREDTYPSHSFDLDLGLPYGDGVERSAWQSDPPERH